MRRGLVPAAPPKLNSEKRYNDCCHPQQIVCVKNYVSLTSGPNIRMNLNSKAICGSLHVKSNPKSKVPPHHAMTSKSEALLHIFHIRIRGETNMDSVFVIAN